VDATAIWKAGVKAVDSARLVREELQREGSRLVRYPAIDLSKVERIIVLGAGKAGGGMTRGVEEMFRPEIDAGRVTGWVNVPADCVEPTRAIHLHAARPAGVNEPTFEGVQGAERILDLASRVRPNDLCLVLISGGGSALLPAPVPGISLADKLAVTRWLMSHGATIQELNTVRRRLSRIKGGGLLRAIPEGRVVTLVISDVIGNPLDLIASGPTVPFRGEPPAALQILARLAPDRSAIPEAVWAVLEAAPPTTSTREVEQEIRVIGDNRTAVDAAAREAERLGYRAVVLGWDQPGVARDVGAELARTVARAVRSENGGSEGVAFISGGEPIVHLAKSDRPRRGGRNQELVLAALVELSRVLSAEEWGRVAVLSGGTDGEDGPTDAAGAVADGGVLASAREAGLDPEAYLAINNSYPFFEATGGLVQTGPTHTNVMDVRVAVVRRGGAP
jgi:glycerate-2-kinase